jgi:hypothetical protein
VEALARGILHPTLHGLQRRSTHREVRANRDAEHLLNDEVGWDLAEMALGALEEERLRLFQTQLG